MDIEKLKEPSSIKVIKEMKIRRKDEMNRRVEMVIDLYRSQMRRFEDGSLPFRVVV